MKRIALIGVLFAAFGLTACSTYSPDFEANKTVAQQLPAKPDADDPRIQGDEEAYKQGLSLRGTERAVLAGKHAEIYKVKQLEATYSPIVGRELSEQATPAFHKILSRLYKVTHEMGAYLKHENHRQRPFAVHPEDKTCRPDLLSTENPNHSYPSGHTISAYSAAVILARIYPEKADAIMDQARTLGESRWICGYHWKSDVEAGKTVVYTLFDRLMEDSSFKEQFEQAKLEATGM